MMKTPLGLIAELTHRCPLRCAYCSNPVELAKKTEELSTAHWLGVIQQAKHLGILQIYFTGGEPCLRPDLVELVRAASSAGLYVNLITSGVGLTQERCQALCDAGVEHIQLSMQDIDSQGAKQVSGVNALAAKLAAAEVIRSAPVAFTINIVVQKKNVERLQMMIDMAVGLGAAKIEVAHVQFNGWAIKNRDLLLPSKEQVIESKKIILAAQEKYQGQVRLDFVLPDYYAKYPKACMNGWGAQMMLIDPKGQVLPCHSAATIPGEKLPSVLTTSLNEIWFQSELFNLFRGDEWMPQMCRTCDRKEIDFGGCRCQALAVAGDASLADPVCHLSPQREKIDDMIQSSAASAENESTYIYRPQTL